MKRVKVSKELKSLLFSVLDLQDRGVKCSFSVNAQGVNIMYQHDDKFNSVDIDLSRPPTPDIKTKLLISKLSKHLCEIGRYKTST